MKGISVNFRFFGLFSGAYDTDENRDYSRRRRTDDDDTVLDNASVTSQDQGNAVIILHTQRVNNHFHLLVHPNSFTVFQLSFDGLI